MIKQNKDDKTGPTKWIDEMFSPMDVDEVLKKRSNLSIFEQLDSHRI